MFCAGSCGRRTPKRAAVPGISCIKPRAPLGDTAPALKCDSCSITRKIKYGSVCRLPFKRMSRSSPGLPVLQPRSFFPFERPSPGFELDAIYAAAIDEDRHTAALAHARQAIQWRVCFDARAAFQINPHWLIVIPAFRRRVSDGFGCFEVIIVVGAFLPVQVWAPA